jgi:hypothetical protein
MISHDIPNIFNYIPTYMPTYIPSFPVLTYTSNDIFHASLHWAEADGWRQP